MRHIVALLVLCTAFIVTARAQTFTTLATFDGSDGANPTGALVRGADGNYYGVTANGGDHFFGTIFRMTPEGQVTTIYGFCIQFGCPDGSFPVGELLQASDGNFYGETYTGGPQNMGTLFRITPAGTLTTLHTFADTDGRAPTGGLIEASDGNFYGTTALGGLGESGTVFRLTPEGVFTVVHEFGYPDGFWPQTKLLQASDGNFYATTNRGGANNWGTIFRMTLNGDVTTLYSFCFGTCTDGAAPAGALIQASDGNLYGTTSQGPPNIAGTVFRTTLDGTLTTLHAFNGNDGGGPIAGVVEATDGNFYGTTTGTCYGSCDTIFRMTPQGAATTLHTFNQTEGARPLGLLQTPDASFYGVTIQGAPYGDGSIFRILAYAPLSLVKLGLGTVTSIDGHIYCGTECSYNFPGGAQISLSAVPSPGYTFTGWTGCDKMNGSYCSVAMTSAKNVTASFDAANITLTSLTLKPGYVKGGQLSAGTLTLNAAAPPGGVTVALSSDHPGVGHPPSFVFVPGGKSSMQFAVQTFPVKSNTTVTITATAGSSQVSGTLMVGTTSLPPSLK